MEVEGEKSVRFRIVDLICLHCYKVEIIDGTRKVLA